MKTYKPTINKPPKLLIYGQGGIGKTDFLASFPKVICLRAENRHDLFGHTEMEVSDVLTGIEQTIEHLDWLKTKDHNFKTVGLDASDTFETLGRNAIAIKYGATSISDPYCKALSFGKGYDMVRDFFLKDIFPRLDWLNENKKMWIVTLSHVVQPWEIDAEGNSYPEYRPAVHAKVKEALEGFHDAVGYMETRNFFKAIEGAKGLEVSSVKTTGERLLRFEKSPRYFSKTWGKINGTLTIPEGKGFEAISKLVPRPEQKKETV